MTDAEVAEQKARVERYIDWWGEELGLRWWRIAYHWHREHQNEPEDNQATMQTTVRWRYLQAFIDIYLPAVAELDDDELEHCVVHEYMHVFVNEMRPLRDKDDPGRALFDDEQRQHEERVATVLAKAFIWVRDQVREEKTDDATA